MTGSARPMRILILGGTAEARALAQGLAARDEFAVTVSLAGRTAEPLPQAAPVRTGGFGGAEGLARYLRDEQVDLLIDATHPYAAAISANAARAADSAGVRLLALRRPPWRKVAGDNWIEVESVEEAVSALGDSAEARVPRARPQGASALRRRPAAHLSRAQRRSGRSAPCRSPRDPTSPRAGRSARTRTARCSRVTTSR